MASAQQALNLDKKVVEANLPPIVAEDASLTQAQEAETHEEKLVLPEDKDITADTPENRTQIDAERERLNQERAVSQQWLELQREAFLSSPATQGNWSGTRQARNAAVPEGEQKSSRRDNPYLEVYEKYLEHENQKAGDASSQAQSDKERFFSARNSGKGVLTSTAQAPISPYIIPSGTMIPCNLITCSEHLPCSRGCHSSQNYEQHGKGYEKRKLPPIHPLPHLSTTLSMNNRILLQLCSWKRRLTPPVCQ